MSGVFDDLDLNTLKILQRNGRVSITELAEKVGASRPTARATPMTTEKTPENSGDLERSLNHPLNWVTNLMSMDEPSSKVSEAIK